MIDKEIRIALKYSLEKQYSNTANTLIIDELGVGHGQARIDVAVVNGNLHGYELKSDKDTLHRLEKQANAYNKVFDRVTLVSAKKHVFKALKKIPDWWGIKIVECGASGSVRFHSIRAPKQNPSPDPVSVLELLWKKEALAFLNEIGVPTNLGNKTKKTIYRTIADRTNITSIKKMVRDTLRSRLDWRVGSQPRPYGG